MLLLVVAGSHLVIPVVMWLRRQELTDQIAHDHPEFSAQALDKATVAALSSAAGFHGVLLLLCVFLAWRLGTGKRWVQRLTVGSQLVSILFSVVSWQSSPMFHAVIPVVGAVQLAIVVLVLRSGERVHQRP